MRTIRLKSGELVSVVGEHTINNTVCYDLKVTEVGSNTQVAVGQEFMLMAPELARNRV